MVRIRFARSVSYVLAAATREEREKAAAEQEHRPGLRDALRGDPDDHVVVVSVAAATPVVEEQQEGTPRPIHVVPERREEVGQSADVRIVRSVRDGAGSAVDRKAERDDRERPSGRNQGRRAERGHAGREQGRGADPEGVGESGFLVEVLDVQIRAFAQLDVRGVEAAERVARPEEIVDSRASRNGAGGAANDTEGRNGLGGGDAESECHRQHQDENPDPQSAPPPCFGVRSQVQSRCQGATRANAGVPARAGRRGCKARRRSVNLRFPLALDADRLYWSL